MRLYRNAAAIFLKSAPLITLTKRIKKSGINPDSINGQPQSYGSLIAVEPERAT